MPFAADDAAETVIVDDAPAFTDVGLNDTLTPDGAPLADSATLCADPEVTAVLTVAVVEAPGATDPDDGATEIEKSLPPPPPPLVNGANVWVKNHWLCEMLEQLSAAGDPG
ncbi:MAG TPA: hypothetical protein VGL21_14665, partial [Jatrophihabitantaceae bacterium]